LFEDGDESCFKIEEEVSVDEFFDPLTKMQRTKKSSGVKSKQKGSYTMQ